MILPIRYYGDSVLKEKAKKVDSVNNQVQELASNLIETMMSEKGLGLAAPQVGVSLRAIAIDIMDDEKDAYVLLNPEITYRSKELVTMEEGCLSFPEIYGKIDRHEMIKVNGTKLDGSEVQLELSGLESRVIQHELDHLDGVLFIDRMSASHKIVLKGKLKKLKKSTKEHLKLK